MDNAANSRDDWADDDGIDLQHIWAVVYRHKWSLIALAFVASAVTALVVNSMTPIYRATAILHIQSEQANIVSIQEIYGIDARRDDYYNTQAEILKSRTIAGKVIDHIGAMPRESSPSPSPSGLPSFDWRSLLPFKPPAPPGGAVKIDPREKQITQYLGGLAISPINGTQLVRVHYDSSDPRRAANFANAHASAYIENILDARLSVTRSATSWMAERVEELRSNLQESEARLQAYREQEKLIDAQGVQALPTLRINDLSARLVDARRRLSTARIAYLQVYGEGSGQIESVPAVLQNSAVQQFRQVQARAEQKVAELGKRYGPKHPKMIAAQSELAEATDNLAAQQRAVSGGIRADFLARQSEVRSLEEELDEAKREYQAVSRKGAGLEELQREVDTNRQLFELFYNRLRETAQTGDLESVNARIVQAAVVPRLPIRPRKEEAVMMAFAVSLAAGIAIVFLLEHLSNTIRSSSEVEEKIGLPILGSVPALGRKASKQAATAVLSGQEKGFGEAIRTIRTGLSLSGLDNSEKVSLVTSSIVGEGKSTVAINLALACARGERVLLIDGDMRRPSIARELDLDLSVPGLPELLGDKAKLKDCFTSFDGFNLDILRTGTVPPDPLELLLRVQFPALMKTVRSAYDHIIIDSPPLLPVSDAAILSMHVDSIVYVVKFDSTGVQQVRAGLKKLPKNHARLAGIVLNQVDERKAEYYGDYSYDGYYEEIEANVKKERFTRQARAASL